MLGSACPRCAASFACKQVAADLIRHDQNAIVCVVVCCHSVICNSIDKSEPIFYRVFLQGDVLLSFTPEATGVSWPAYVDLYCAGAKQLFFHEKPKVHLQLEPVILSNL